MARFRYQHIKSSVEGKAPTSEQIKIAEIAINDFAGDEKLFIKNSSGDVVDFPRSYSIGEIDDFALIVSSALNDLEDKKADANMVATASEFESHTGDTSIHHTHDNKTYLDTVTGNVNTMAYQNASSYSSATQVNTALGEKVNTADIVSSITSTNSASTNPISTGAIMSIVKDNEEVISSLLNDLNTRKADSSAVTESISEAISGKADTSALTEHTSNTTIHVTAEDKAKWNTVEDKADTSALTEHTSDSTIHLTTGNVQSIIDDNLGSGFTSSSVTEVIESNERIVSSALNDLDARKADSSAVTESIEAATSGKTDTSAFTAHTSDTTVHLTSTEKANLHTHSNKSALDSITGSVGTMAYQNANSYSSATQVDTALDGKVNTSDIDQVIDSTTSASTDPVSTSAVYGFVTSYTPSITVDQVLDETTSASTNPIATQAVYEAVADLSGQSETVAAALVDLNSQSETVATALVDLDARIVELSGHTPTIEVDEVIDDTTSASTNPVATKAVYDAIIENEEITSAALTDLDDRILDLSGQSETVAAALVDLNSQSETVATALVDLDARIVELSGHTPGATVDQVIDSTTSASTNAVATKAVYEAITDNELVWTNAYVTLSGAVSSHTANNSIHMSQADRDKLNSLTGTVGTMAYENVNSYSSATDISTALNGKSDTGHTHVVADITGLGTMATQNTSSYSSATEVENALSGKVNTSDIIQTVNSTTSASTNPVSTKAVVDVIASNERVTSAALNDLNTALGGKSDTGHTHSISDVSNLDVMLGVVSAVTVSSDLSNVTCPDSITGASNTGAHAAIIYENSGTTTDYVITISTNYKSPDGQQISLICPKNGYCEINYLNIGGTIYARGA